VRIGRSNDPLGPLDRSPQLRDGGLYEILLANSGIAIAVVIFPTVMRVDEKHRLGYIASGTVESIIIDRSLSTQNAAAPLDDD